MGKQYQKLSLDNKTWVFTQKFQTLQKHTTDNPSLQKKKKVLQKQISLKTLFLNNTKKLTICNHKGIYSLQINLKDPHKASIKRDDKKKKKKRDDAEKKRQFSLSADSHGIQF